MLPYKWQTGQLIFCWDFIPSEKKDELAIDHSFGSFTLTAGQKEAILQEPQIISATSGAR